MRYQAGLFLCVAMGALASVCGFAGEPTQSPAALSTRQLAESFVRKLFVEHDMKAAYAAHVSPDFIQHNPEVPASSEGELAFFSKRQRADPERYLPVEQWADVIDSVLVDSDLFAVHHHVFTHPNDRGRVFVDIWRVAGGKIVEHWDVIQPVPESAMNDATMWCGKGGNYSEARRLGDTLTAPTCGKPDITADRARSLATIEGYVRALGTPGSVAEAVKTFVARDFVQHSPHIAPGTQPLIEDLTERYNPHATTKRRLRVVRTLAEGDRVLLHRYVQLDGEPDGTAAVDLFQVRDGKIVAHWDVMQRLPPDAVENATVAANGKRQ